ncbi:Dihydroorotate dehydrogenase [Bienertia sinuspersici]
MSYCAHEKKLFLVPFPLIFGFVFAGILKETTQEVSPIIKQDAEVPWHLIAIAAFLTLLKLPGPHYPYWGRIFIPHFANGGLLRVFLMIYFWYQRPKKSRLLQYVESAEQN